MEGLIRECRNYTILCVRPKIASFDVNARGERSGSIRENLYGIHRANVGTMTRSQHALPNRAEHYPLTNDQFQEVQRDVLEMNGRADELAQLLAAAFGEADQRTIRAKETDAALQRLQWAMQRGKATKAS
jgi:hypothetical protein